MKQARAADGSPLEMYLREIDQIPLLTAEEEREVARRVAQGDSEARERMIRANLRLVVSIARQYVHKGLGLMDLIAEGNIGLLRAVERYDPDSGFRFSTYATWWIKQAIRRALTSKVKTIHVPAYMVELVAKWKQAASTLADRLGREPTSDEVAREINISPERAAIIKRALHAYDTHASSPDEEAWALSEMLPDERTRAPEEVAFDKYEREKIDSILQAIDRREAEVLRLRYGLDDGKPKTLREIGEKMGLTRERVRQIENEALRKLHEMMERELPSPARMRSRKRSRT